MTEQCGELRRLYNRNGIWHARFNIAGASFRRTLRTTDIEEAKARGDELYRRESARVFFRQKVRSGGVHGPMVYFIGPEVGPVKIGVATDLDRRHRELIAANPHPVFVFAATHGGYAQERAYHRQFEAYRLHGEWFARAEEIEAEIARLVAVSAQKVGTLPTVLSATDCHNSLTGL